MHAFLTEFPTEFRSVSTARDTKNLRLRVCLPGLLHPIVLPRMCAKPPRPIIEPWSTWTSPGDRVLNTEGSWLISSTRSAAKSFSQLAAIFQFQTTTHELLERRWLYSMCLPSFRSRSACPDLLTSYVRVRVGAHCCTALSPRVCCKKYINHGKHVV